MPNQAIATEIIKLEKQFWNAMKDGDADTMSSLSDEECIVAGAQGVSKIKRGDYAKMMESAPYTLRDFKIQDDYQVSVLNDDLAVIAYKVSEELEVDGESIKLDASDASTWIRKNGKWVCSLHTESITGDPFGRDRRASINEAYVTDIAYSESYEE